MPEERDGHRPTNGAGVKPSPEERDRLIEECWALYCRGTRNLSQIGRTVGLHRETVKRYLALKRARLLHEAEDLRQIRADLAGEFEQVRSRAWREAQRDDNQAAARIGALRLIRDVVKDMAALLGVATERVDATVEVKMSATVEPNGDCD